jgi:hypothetical protein
MKKLNRIFVIIMFIEFCLIPVTITINLFMKNQISKNIISSNLIFLFFTIVLWFICNIINELYID